MYKIMADILDIRIFLLPYIGSALVPKIPHQWAQLFCFIFSSKID